MKIVLNELRITNFKGITDKVVKFGRETFIHGVNGSGKTTIADAFFWLLFGKNSQDEKTFGIKNTVKTELNEMDHVVEADITIDGKKHTLKHVYREKWQRKKGSSTPTYTGNENEYWWNDAPLQLKEWNAKISKLIDEGIFKLITNPNYFNTMLSWQDRRKTLLEMAGKIDMGVVIKGNKALEDLYERLKGNTMKDFRATLSAKKSKLKEESVSIPARIDELKKSLQEETPDFDALEAEANTLKQQLADVDEALQSKSSKLKKFHDEQAKVQSEIHSLKRQLADLRNSNRIQLENDDRSASADIDATKALIAKMEKDIAALEKDKAASQKRIEDLNKSIAGMREKWEAMKLEKFEYPPFEYDPESESCPHCKQLLPADTIATRKATLEKNYADDRKKKEEAFNQSLLNRKNENKAEGKRLADSRDSILKEVEETSSAIALKSADLDTAVANLQVLESKFTKPEPIETRLEEVMKNNKDARAFETAIAAQIRLLQDEPAEDNEELKKRKQELQAAISDIQKKLGMKDSIANTEVRITKLAEDQKNYAQQLADLEKEEHLLLQFEKLHMEQMQQQVNGMFKYVTFKLFETQVNGGENPCCETLLDGVPFSDLNTAGRIKAGIDIINALSAHHNVWAPIFLDNRESVTEIPKTESQVISLVVSPKDKKLRVEYAQEEEAVA